MQEQLNHDRVIAKLQHFADSIRQRKLEKESLVIVIGDKEKSLKEQISVYEEILEEYYTFFEEILSR